MFPACKTLPAGGADVRSWSRGTVDGRVSSEVFAACERLAALVAGEATFILVRTLMSLQQLVHHKPLAARWTLVPRGYLPTNFNPTQLVLCEYPKFRIKSNSYISIRFDSKQAQLFEILEYLPSVRHRFLTYLTE